MDSVIPDASQICQINGRSTRAELTIWLSTFRLAPDFILWPDMGQCVDYSCRLGLGEENKESEGGRLQGIVMILMIGKCTLPCMYAYRTVCLYQVGKIGRTGWQTGKVGTLDM